MRILLSLLCALCAITALCDDNLRLPPISATPLDGYCDINAVKKRLAESGPHRIEGVWQFPQNGTTVAIERHNSAGSLPGSLLYRMTVVRSANRAIRPGTVMGVLCPSAGSNVYDARIYTSSRLAGKLDSPKHFTLTLTESDTHLVFKPVKSKYSFNLWRMLPYMFRYSVRTNTNTGEAPRGCVRLFPEPEIPLAPRYL